MQSKKNIYMIILLFLFVTFMIIVGTYYYITTKQKNLLTSIYNTTNKNIIKTTESLIEDKQNTTLAIALALTKNDNLYKFMKDEKYEKLNYQKIVDEIAQNSKYKNVWIQIVDKSGNSIYRSWTDKKGDNLLFRKDLKNTLTIQSISTSISVGIFNLTLKARAPIYDNENNFQGALEVITHFNSITKDLKDNNIESLVITEKKYKDTIKFPYTNIFIDDYYVANKNANIAFVNYVRKNGVEKYINISDFTIENGYLISNYPLFDKNGEKLASIINFLDFKNIDTQIIKSFKVQIIMTSVITLIILFFSFLIYFYTIYLKKIKHQENKKQSILDSQLSIIVITNGKEIIDANKKLFEFFKDVSNLKEFKEKYICICKAFIDMKDENYIFEKDYNGKNWAEYVLENDKKNFRVAMKNENSEIRHFSLKTSKIASENFIIATLSDITQDLVKIEEDKEKDRFLYQQSKIAAIADTLKNVAHQWRQPLSVISTIASGLKLQKELNNLDDFMFNNSCDAIINNTQKLSNTIENFTNFFPKEDLITNFSFVEALKDTINFFDSIFEKNSIKCQFTYDTDMVVNCNRNDFSQAILNILDNSVYALIQNKKEEERFIFIDFSNKVLQIKDNAEGINEEDLQKVLEPYFTTKHQSFGVGLGLYIVQEFFVNNLKSKIDIKNVEFEYKNINYKGTNFIIDFN